MSKHKMENVAYANPSFIRPQLLVFSYDFNSDARADEEEDNNPGWDKMGSAFGGAWQSQSSPTACFQRKNEL